MAVFTAIATAIVGAIGVTGIAATIATSIISAGLALGTAKALGVFEPPKQQQQKDPGVKIQLPPSTDNRIPVFYGRNYTGGIIVDAGIKNQNNTMSYVMVIGEKTDSGTYTVDKIYRDDAELTFNSTSNAVVSAIDPNNTSSNRIGGKFRVNIYAGNAQSSVNQIFPPSGTKVAAQTLLPTIDATTNYEDLVYAICEIDYDPENSLTGLGAITFRITNTLSEPSNVLLDYLQNDRYGAGLSSSDLVLSTFNDLYDHANINGSTGNVEYLTSANVSAYHSRYQIDGMLSTYVPVKQNINEICKSCSTFFTYNSKEGKFQVVPNRAATTAEKSAAFVLNDDNITSGLEITSTELYSLYNSIDVEYPSYEQKDQTKTLVIDTPSGDRNTNEPDNPLNTRYDLVNDAPRVHNLANIDLRQSRLSTVVSLTADYSAIQIDVGDIIKLTSSLYGFSDKLFRVMRVTEVETADAMLGVKLVLLEYDDSVYTHNVVKSDSAVGFSLIPGWWTGIIGNANINIGNITITDPGNANANIVDGGNGNVIGNVDYGNIDWANISFGGIGGLGGIGVTPSVPIIDIPITIPDIAGIEELVVDIGTSSNSNVTIQNNTTITIPPFTGNTTFTPNTTVNVAVPVPDNTLKDPTLPNFGVDTSFLANINIFGIGHDGGGEWSTPTTVVPDVELTNQGTTTVDSLQDIGVGFQIDEAPSTVTDMPFAGSFTALTANATTSNVITFSNVNDLDYIVDSNVSGTGIPANTVITAVNSNTQVVVNNNVSLGAGDTVTLNNANATTIGQPASEILPAVTVDLGGIEYGDYTNLFNMSPRGGLGAGNAGTLAFKVRDTIAYEEVHESNLVPTGNTIFDIHEGSTITTQFAEIPTFLANNFKADISLPRGQTAANIAYASANITPPANMQYYAKNVSVQPFANSTLDEAAGQRGLAFKGDVLRNFKADLYKGLRP